MVFKPPPKNSKRKEIKKQYTNYLQEDKDRAFLLEKKSRRGMLLDRREMCRKGWRFVVPSTNLINFVLSIP